MSGGGRPPPGRRSDSIFSGTSDVKNEPSRQSGQSFICPGAEGRTADLHPGNSTTGGPPPLPGPDGRAGQDVHYAGAAVEHRHLQHDCKQADGPALHHHVDRGYHRGPVRPEWSAARPQAGLY